MAAVNAIASVAVLARSFSIVGWWLEVGDAKPRPVIRFRT